jgi:hypothetical protein
MHSKTAAVRSSSQMQVSWMYNKKLTSLGIKDLGMTLQSRKEGKQKGTSVSSMKQSSRSKHQAMAFPIAGRLASQELAHARHGTARDSLERSRLWTGANKRCTIIKAKKRGEESTASAPLASCNSMDIWSVQPSSLSEARPKGASTPVSDEAQPSCIQTGSC